MATKPIQSTYALVTKGYTNLMFIEFPPLKVAITELADLMPVEITDAGVGPILDEDGNTLLDTDNRMILDEVYG